MEKHENDEKEASSRNPAAVSEGQDLYCSISMEILQSRTNLHRAARQDQTQSIK